MNLVFSWDTTQIEALRSQGLERALVRTLSMAGGDAIRAARVTSSRNVRDKKKMKVARVNRGLKLVLPRGARAIDSLEWRVDVGGAMVPIASFSFLSFGARIQGRAGRKERSSGGISAAINVGSRSKISSAFSLTLRSGHEGVFLRTGAKVGPKGGQRPFRELFTTRISDVFKDQDTAPTALIRAQTVFASSFARLLPLEIAKAK